jgi:hypothetical protein
MPESNQDTSTRAPDRTDSIKPFVAPGRDLPPGDAKAQEA